MLQKIGAALVNGIKPLVISAVPGLRASVDVVKQDNNGQPQQQAKLKLVPTQEVKSEPENLPVTTPAATRSAIPPVVAQALHQVLALLKKTGMPLWRLRAKDAYQSSSKQKSARFKRGTLIDEKVE